MTINHLLVSSAPWGRIPRAWSLAVLCLLLFCAPAAAQEQTEGSDLLDRDLAELLEIRVVPVNVLGNHTHYKGEWMISYRPMYMSMAGNRDGTNRLDSEEVLVSFPVTPEKMTMEMHMLGFMYAPSDRVTLMAMVPTIDLSMDHVTRSGKRFTTQSSGVGDVKLGGLFTFLDRDQRRLMVTGMVSLPTGSVDERGATPMGPNQKLPYPMQLGSGTYDLLPGVSYNVETERWALGGEILGTVRLDENSDDYTLGDRLEIGAWAQRSFTRRLSLTSGLRGRAWEDVSGADPELNPNIVPTADPNLRGGERLDLTLGLSFFRGKGEGTQGLRFAVEVGVPIYQSLDGPQLESDWLVHSGVQWTWKL